MLPFWSLRMPIQSSRIHAGLCKNFHQTGEEVEEDKGCSSFAMESRWDKESFAFHRLGLTFPLFAQHRWWVNQCFNTLLVSCVLIVRTLAISPWISPCAIILLNECPLINWKYFVFGCCSVAVSLSTNSMLLLVVCGPGWSCHPATVNQWQPPPRQFA